ncbi:TPA: ABC transporter ATP-binding protein, partial [Vibrio vulnificus]
FGEIVEYGKSVDLYNNPQNDYTKKLLSAIPITHPKYRVKKREVTRKIS